MSFPKVFSSMSIPSFAKTDLRSSIEILPLLSKGKKGTYWRWKTYLWKIFQRLITRRALSNKSKTLEGIFKYSQACIKIQEGFSQVNVHGVSWVIESWRMQIQLINDRIATETRTPLNEGKPNVFLTSVDVTAAFVVESWLPCPEGEALILDAFPAVLFH